MARKKSFAVGDSVEHPKEGLAVVEGVRTLHDTGFTQIAVARVSPTGESTYLGWKSGRYWKIVKKASDTSAVSEPSPVGCLVTPNPEMQKPPCKLVDSVFPGRVANPAMDDELPVADAAMQAVARGFAFDYKNPVVHLWMVHKFVPGEAVRYKGVSYRITATSFDTDQIFSVTLGPVNDVQEPVIVWEKDNGKLPLRPDKLKSGESVCHAKHGTGTIIGFVGELPLVKFQESTARLMKGKKLRRVHLSPEPISG